jgi:hypothetical protein
MKFISELPDTYNQYDILIPFSGKIKMTSYARSPEEALIEVHKKLTLDAEITELNFDIKNSEVYIEPNLNEEDDYE